MEINKKSIFPGLLRAVLIDWAASRHKFFLFSKTCLDNSSEQTDFYWTWYQTKHLSEHCKIIIFKIEIDIHNFFFKDKMKLILTF